MSGSLPVLAICDKLYNYNREEEMAKLDGLYHQYIKEMDSEALWFMISGGAGFEGGCECILFVAQSSLSTIYY